MHKGVARMWPFKKKPEQPPPPENETAWRTMDWKSDKQKLLTTIKSFQPGNPEVDTLRILLHGPVGAGKSSFFNSLDNALLGRITTRALAHSVQTDRSFTVKYQTYKLKKDEFGSYYPLTFSDIAGMQSEGGIRTGDIIKILGGHITSGYTFNPRSSITEDDPKYNREPNRKDRIHCLVAVLPANTVSMTDDDILKQMREVREKARDLGIPQVIIMTKVDEACPLVKSDLQKIYTSKKIKQKMEECSVKLGVPVSCIFPVKNYHEENATNVIMDILILDALKNIVNFANDHVEHKLVSGEDS
ncbi:interferon-induced protein 44 isoform X2 [Danio rerio]|nr:interferon-induced protein 44 [Danio rerio]|eukprot:XP_021331626.1 interferon-induced protein 44 [Danio rerio]